MRTAASYRESGIGVFVPSATDRNEWQYGLAGFSLRLQSYLSEPSGVSSELQALNVSIATLATQVTRGRAKRSAVGDFIARLPSCLCGGGAPLFLPAPTSRASSTRLRTLGILRWRTADRTC